MFGPSTNLIDDIKEEIAGFREDLFGSRSIEIIKDPETSLEEWIYAVFGLMKDHLGHPFHSIDTTDKSTLLDNITTFTMFYSKEFSATLDLAKDKLKLVTETQSFGPASAWGTSCGLDSVGLRALMKRVSNFSVLTEIADWHLSMRRLQRLNDTMKQSSQVLTERVQAIVIDAYNVDNSKVSMGLY
ncbi:hypothetical protein DFH11DRAFT_626166 [Phellopilus nigrolimitatus]|nr:hypothetical protein DFH11DRAFT_626166 [Phellopilus nigrolimitatus]